MEDKVRWTLTVSRETDEGLRSLLSTEGRRRDALSRFVDQVVRKELFARTIAKVRSRNAKVNTKIIHAEIAEAIAYVRGRSGGRSSKLRRRPL